MSQEEIKEYNHRCAAFLGSIYSEHAKAWAFGNAKNIGSKMFDGVMYDNVIQAERFEKELKFHSDWNWIMEVVEAINKFGVVEIETYDIGTTLCIIKAKDYYHQSFDNSIKKAVVTAINDFLIWYNDEQKLK